MSTSQFCDVKSKLAVIFVFVLEGDFSDRLLLASCPEGVTHIGDPVAKCLNSTWHREAFLWELLVF